MAERGAVAGAGAGAVAPAGAAYDRAALAQLVDQVPPHYWAWIQGVWQLDFSIAIRASEPVSDALRSAFPVTRFLGAYGFILATVGGVTVGILAALRRRTVVDRGLVAALVVGVSAPALPRASRWSTCLRCNCNGCSGWAPARGSRIASCTHCRRSRSR